MTKRNFVLFLLFFVVSAFCGCLPEHDPNAKPSEGVLKIKVWVKSQYLVESKLKYPNTAKYPFGGGQEHVTVNGNLFTVDSYVDSQEGRKHFSVTFKNTGGKDDWEIEKPLTIW